MVTFLMALGSAKVAWSCFPLAGAEGSGFASKEWRLAETMHYVKRLPKGTLVFCNRAQALWFYTDQTVQMVPELYDINKGSNDLEAAVAGKLALIAKQLEEQKGCAVAFTNTFYPTRERHERLMAEAFSKGTAKIMSGGVVYEFDPVRAATAH